MKFLLYEKRNTSIKNEFIGKFKKKKNYGFIDH